MLHTAHALIESEHVVIQTPDTDVYQKFAGKILMSRWERHQVKKAKVRSKVTN